MVRKFQAFTSTNSLSGGELESFQNLNARESNVFFIQNITNYYLQTIYKNKNSRQRSIELSGNDIDIKQGFWDKS